MKFAHHSHYGHRRVDVVQVSDVAADYLQVAVVVGIRVNQLNRTLRKDF